MANYDVTLDIQVTDVYGDSAKTSIALGNTPDTTTLAALATDVQSFGTAIQACTNGKVTQLSVTALVSKAQISAGTAPPPTSAIYPSVTDGARLTFANSAGFRRALTIPAPLLSDFKTNSNVVEPSDPNIAALITLVEGTGTSPNITNLYEGGSKVGRRLRRRVTHRSL